MKRLTYATLILSQCILLIGCGVVFPTGPMNYAPSNSTNFAVTTSGTSSSNSMTNSSNYSCPGLSNVIPQLNVSTDGTGNYIVCPSKTTGDDTDILVHGKTSNSQSICVFPMQQGQSSMPSPILDSTGAPVYVCALATSGGAFLSFAQSQVPNGFNAVAIVEGGYQYSMSQCILNGLFYCPNYSYGKFR
jgi:hypothetical protein